MIGRIPENRTQIQISLVFSLVLITTAWTLLSDQPHVPQMISYPDLTLFDSWPWEIWVRNYHKCTSCMIVSSVLLERRVQGMATAGRSGTLWRSTQQLVQMTTALDESSKTKQEVETKTQQKSNKVLLNRVVFFSKRVWQFCCNTSCTKNCILSHCSKRGT